MKKIDIYPLKLYIQNISLAILLGLSLVLNLLTWVWLWVQIPRDESQLFLHYNVLFGVDNIGDSWHIFYVPLIGLIILMLNTVLGWVLFKKDKFIAQLLSFVSLVCQIYLFISAVLLVFLNG